MDVVVVADPAVPRIAGHLNAVGRLGPGKSAGGCHRYSKAGGDNDAGELHGGWLGVSLVM